MYIPSVQVRNPKTGSRIRVGANLEDTLRMLCQDIEIDYQHKTEEVASVLAILSVTSDIRFILESIVFNREAKS